jgi:ATP/maltotriose-dependent transcriptional regulator MalT
MCFAWAALRAGDLDAALVAGEDVERLLARWPTVPMMGGICALSEARVEAGAPEHGRDALLAVYGGADLEGIEPIFRPWAYEILTRAELAAERLDAAAEWATRACETAAVLGLGRDRASALTAHAAVALARGDAAAAATTAQEAARVADSSSSPVHAGRARTLAGEALDRAGDRESAVRELVEGHRQLRACGAARYADEAAAVLRRLGRRPPRGGQRREPGEGLAALSEREREVAELVVARLTNREIAARLFVSQKTVERHMHSIFEKLGVDSRVGVARAVERGRARVTGVI